RSSDDDPALAQFISELRGEVIALRDYQKKCEALLAEAGIAPPALEGARPSPLPEPRRTAEPVREARRMWAEGRVAHPPPLPPPRRGAGGRAGRRGSGGQARGGRRCHRPRSRRGSPDGSAFASAGAGARAGGGDAGAAARSGAGGAEAARAGRRVSLMEQIRYSGRRLAEVLGLSVRELAEAEDRGAVHSTVPPGGPTQKVSYSMQDLAAARAALNRVPPRRTLRRQLFLNFKGGTGKTSVSTSYAFRLAEMGHRVLVIDLDSQGHASKCLGICGEEADRTLFDAIIKKEPVETVILKTGMPG